MSMQFLIIWYLCGGSDVTEMEEIQEPALLLVLDDYHSNYLS